MLTQIAPSILSADFARLAAEIQEVEQAGADLIHVDVMDGHFVPNITIGPAIVSAIRPHTKLPLDVHLMITEPDRYIQDFVKAGADLVSVHVETCMHLHRTLQVIKNSGAKASVALNPATSLHVLEHVLPDLDMVLLMAVNPGFGGQIFIQGMLDKIRQLRQLLNEKGFGHIPIEVDGGIQVGTAKEVVEAGANVLVAGSAIFGKEDRFHALQAIRHEIHNF